MINYNEAAVLCEMGYSVDFVLDRMLMQERVFPPSPFRARGATQRLPSHFPMHIWQRPGLGFLFGIEKSGYKSPPTKREYIYGPFARGQARSFLSRLGGVFSNDRVIFNPDALLDQLVGTQVVLLIEVDAGTLAQIWKSSRFGKDKFNVVPSSAGSKQKLAG